MKNKIQDILNNTKKAVVLSHINPDGDAVGSTIGLSRLLNNMGISTTGILPNKPAPNLRIIQGIENIVYNFDTPQKASELIAEADLIFCIDFNLIDERIGDLKLAVRANTSAKRVLIDHHQTPPMEDFDLVFSDPKKSSTSLMIYDFAKLIGKTDLFDIAAAEALYIGMMTDTGNFTYGNLTGELFESVAALVRIGVQPNILYSKIFNSQTESQIRLRSYALHKKMYINKEYKYGYIVLDKDELKEFDFVEGDLEGLVNVPLSIDGVLNSAIFIEKKDLIKISLRSLIDGKDMNLFAREYFNGGGHINAAGGKYIGAMQDAIQTYTEGIEKLYKA